MYLYVCESVRFGDHGTAKRSESGFFVPLLQCWGACAFTSVMCLQLWKNTFFCGSPPGTQHTGDVIPAQIMLNLFSVHSQRDIKLRSLNYRGLV